MCCTKIKKNAEMDLERKLPKIKQEIFGNNKLLTLHNKGHNLQTWRDRIQHVAQNNQSASIFNFFWLRLVAWVTQTFSCLSVCTTNIDIWNTFYFTLLHTMVSAKQQSGCACNLAKLYIQPCQRRVTVQIIIK